MIDIFSTILTNNPHYSISAILLNILVNVLSKFCNQQDFFLCVMEISSVIIMEIPNAFKQKQVKSSVTQPHQSVISW